MGLLIKFLTKAIEKYYQSTSSTVFIHNYNPSDPESLQQMYVHIIPRKELDFTNKDHIYKRLEGYDAEQYFSKFVKQFKWAFTSANAGVNGELEIQGIESKKYQQFLEGFQKEEMEKS